ncbi:M23 family metallopeptidase [Streptomyces phaeoluteigriseus]|uniref:M23 family metallopeptidase n=1 Tax=Streptomyces phaeoluteigriseus TaxID=114686 RepID=UPI0036771D9A
MPSHRPVSLLVPVVLCAAAVLVARPATADGQPGGDGAGGGPGSGLSAQVARLYEEAAVASQEYEARRVEAEAQRAKVQRLEQLLDRERREITVLRDDLGRIARAQYRGSGGLPVAAQLVLSSSPDELMRGQRVLSRTHLVVDTAIGKSRRAENRLAADEARATGARRALERRTAELAVLKKGITQKLEQARWQLQGQADASVAAGSCRGAERLDGPPTRDARKWVVPVDGYTLSAGFGSGGARWAGRHTGQDFAVPIGTPVKAVGAGRVVRVSCGGAFGIEIVLQHAGGYYTQYAHLASVAVDQGESVTAGRRIGQSGTSGNSTGPHLHFEVRVTPEMGSAVDPVPWLAARGAPVG